MPRIRAASIAIVLAASGLLTVSASAATTAASTADPGSDQVGVFSSFKESITDESAAPAAYSSIPRGYPNASTTGHKSTPTRAIGRREIRTNGATLRNVRITGQIVIKADNVRLENVLIQTRDSYGVLVYGRNAKILDSTIEGTPGSTLAGIAATDRGTFDARRVDVSRVEDGVRLTSTSALRDSFIHNLRGSRSSHYDAVTADGFTSWLIYHNTILNHQSQTAAVWVGDNRYRASSGLLSRNYIAGGGFSIYSGHGTGMGIRVRDNRFSTRYFSRSGYYGVAYEWERSRNTWEGNKWIDGPRRGRGVSP